MCQKTGPSVSWTVKVGRRAECSALNLFFFTGSDVNMKNEVFRLSGGENKVLLVSPLASLPRSFEWIES